MNFRKLFSAAGMANLGDGILSVALPWFATMLTTDAMLVGLVAAMRQLPWFLLSLPAGVLTDRFDNRLTIVFADVSRIFMILIVIVLCLTATPGNLAITLLAGLSFLIGAAEVLRDNTAQTLLPDLVEAGQLERANSALWSTETLLGQFIGPPLAGLLIGFSIALPFGLTSALWALSIAFMLHLVVARKQPTGPVVAMWPALRSAVAWLWGEPMLRRLALVLGGFNFIGYGFWAVLVLYGQQILGLNSLEYGLLLTMSALGGLAATLIGPWILDRTGPTAAIFFGMGMFTLASLTLALGAPIWVILPVLVIDAFGGMLWNIATVSYRQRFIPKELLGRVNAVYRFFGTGPAAFGAFFFGALVSWGEVYWGHDALYLPYYLSSVIGVCLFGYCLVRLRLR